eukprot:gene9382-11525_t
MKNAYRSNLAVLNSKAFPDLACCWGAGFGCLTIPPDVIVNEISDKKRKIPKIPITLKCPSKTVKRSRYRFNNEEECFPMEQSLPRWDVSTFKPDSTTLVIGKRRTGKSYFIRYLCYHIREHFPMVIVMTKTGDVNRWWHQCVDYDHIFGEWRPDIIHALIQRNKKILTSSELKKVVNPNVLLILDDIIGENSFKTDTDLSDLFTLGRHVKICLILATQYVYGVGPLARGNTDYIFSCVQTQKRQRDAIADDYGDIIDKKDFLGYLDDNTQDNNMLVIDLSVNSSDPTKVFSTVKADNPGPFIMGSEECWQSEMATAQLDEIFNENKRDPSWKT